MSLILSFIQHSKSIDSCSPLFLTKFTFMGNIILFFRFFSKVNPTILNLIYFFPSFISKPLICLKTTSFITLGISVGSITIFVVIILVLVIIVVIGVTTVVSRIGLIMHVFCSLIEISFIWSIISFVSSSTIFKYGIFIFELKKLFVTVHDMVISSRYPLGISHCAVEKSDSLLFK